MSLKAVPRFTTADAQRWAEMLAEQTRRDVVKAMRKRADMMVTTARKTHKFKTITGKADASIMNSVVYDAGNKSATLTFYIDPSDVMVGGYNRTWMLNDGTYGSYEQGFISPTAITVGGEAGTGIKHDDFMGKSWVKHLAQLENDFEKIWQRMK